MVGFHRVKWLNLAVCDRAHIAHDVELALGIVYFTAEQRDARTILFGLIQQFKRVASRARAAAEHADHELRIEGDEFFECPRAVVGIFQEFWPVALQYARN